MAKVYEIEDKKLIGILKQFTKKERDVIERYNNLIELNIKKGKKK
ncbi:unnamed protein product [marine sediment metagenome]|uniref:Uncharacterized protein n=1 Tax=marine sediment metagenome TaxID=412755 RepID=X1T6A0_9ZZZZ